MFYFPPEQDRDISNTAPEARRCTADDYNPGTGQLVETEQVDVTPVRKRVRRTGGCSADHVLSVICDKLSCIRQEDEWDIYGKTVASNMRKLPNAMQPYAQKLISDVIFYAQIGELDLTSKITTAEVEPIDPNKKQKQGPL